MRQRHRRSLLPIAALLATLGAGAARAELPQPGCEALAQWAEGHERREGWSPNGLGGRDRFSALFAEPQTAALFGKPVLDWTPEEARALAPHLAECGNTLRRAGNRDAGSALARLRIQAQREIPAYLAARAEARAAVPRLLAALAEEVPSLPLLRLHQALGDIGTEPTAPDQANQAIRGLGAEARNQARDLLRALRDLPEAELAMLLAPAEARVPTLRDGVIQASAAEFAAVPPTLAGLQALDRLERDLPEQAAALGPEGIARMQAALAARRAAVGDALRDGLLAQLAEAPADARSVQLLARIGQQARQQYAAAIGAEGVRAVEAAIVARRRAIGTAVVEEMVGRVASATASPGTLAALHRLETEPENPTSLMLIGPEGLRRVRQAAAARRLELGPDVAAALRRQLAAVPAVAESFLALDQLVPPALLSLLPPAEAAGLAEAAAGRRRAIAEAVLPGLRAELAGLPLADESLALIDGRVMGAINDLPASAAEQKARFAALAQARRTEILAAVNRAEAGPLRGRLYEAPRLTLEFLDRTRVVVTEPGAPPEAGTYAEEPDGRVIVTVGGRSLVMTREGRRLVAGPLVARRVK